MNFFAWITWKHFSDYFVFQLSTYIRGLQLGEGVDGDNCKTRQVDGKARQVDSQKMSSLGCRLPSPAQSRNMASCML